MKVLLGNLLFCTCIWLADGLFDAESYKLFSVLRSVWSSWQEEDAEALDITLVDSSEELGKHAFSPNRYLLLTSMYVSKRLPEASSLPTIRNRGS
jgi:hypothetical protein